MLTPEEWLLLLEMWEHSPAFAQVETFHQLYGSASAPVRVTCSDGEQWVIKGPKDRTPFNEQVIGCLGRRLGSPIPPIAILELTEELRNAEPSLHDMTPGFIHGSRFQRDCADREGLKHWNQPENRPRFAALAVLYTWMHATDHQVLFEATPPNRVWSVDHGHFFTGTPQWTPALLAALPRPTQLDVFFGPASLTSAELAPPFALLSGITAVDIAEAVARPPDQWGVMMDERVALCMYLEERQRIVLSLRSAS